MVSDPTKRYLEEISSLPSKQDPGSLPVSVIHVDYIASKLATLYEKVRQVIDYQEEHLLRKNAIERMLRRRLFLSLSPEELAGPLVFELIRGGYFPNDRMPETKIEEVQRLLGKYVFLIGGLQEGAPRIQKNQLTDWLVGLASSEIEEKLAPPGKETALLSFMVRELEKRLVFTEPVTDEQRKKELIFIACQRSLLKADNSLLCWRLLKLKFPDFSDPPNHEFLFNFSQNLASIKEEVGLEIADPLVRKIVKKARGFSPVFLILQDVALENQSGTFDIFQDPSVLETRIKIAFDKRYQNLKAQSRRMGIRWLISIFLSKMVFAFLIEVPYDRMRGNFSTLALGVNILIPPLFMLLLISSIRIPKEENKTKILLEAMRIVYTKEKEEAIEVEKTPKRKGFTYFSIKLFFFATSLAVFSLVIFLLLKINFSWLSIFIFIAFFSLIAFSAMRIETATRQLKAVVKEKEEGLTSFIADIFFIPFRTLGKWLSGQLQKYNLIILILNLFFEAPLQVFFEFLENWRDFIKKKKEEME